MYSLRSVGIGVLSAITIAACGGDSGPGDGSGGSNGQITGRERIGWDQPASSPQDLAALRYILWIDDSPDYMTGVSCDALRSGVAMCSGPLRAMSPGPHQLSLSAVGPDGTSSPRSPALSVNVTTTQSVSPPFVDDTVIPGDGATGAAQASRPTEVMTTAGPLRIDVVADDLAEVTDLVATADGRRLFVAERRGVVRAWAGRVALAAPVLALDDVVTQEGTGLLSVTLAPDYQQSGHVYVGYMADTGFRVARYRDVAGAWAERAVVFETTPDTPYTAAVVRFGPDGRLYVALDDEGDARHGGDLGSFSGKVLRLNRDGSVPDDQPGYSPVHMTDVGRPGGLAWALADDRLWVANGGHAGGGTLDVARPDVGTSRRGTRRTIAARYAVPGGETPTAAVLYAGEAFKAWEGDLLVSLRPSGHLLRLDLDRTSPDAIVGTDIVLDGSLGPMRAIVVAADGSLFLAGERQLLHATPRPEAQ